MTSTSWTNGTATGLWAVDGNWDNNQPTITVDATVAGSDAIVSSVPLWAKDLNFTGFTGSLSQSAGSTIATDIRGQLTLASGMTLGSGIKWTFGDALGGNVSPIFAGKTVYSVQFNGSTGDVTMVEDWTLAAGINAYGVITGFHFGTHILRVFQGTNLDASTTLWFPDAGTTFSAGAKLVVGAPTGTDVDFYMGQTLPWTEIATSGGTVVLESTYPLLLERLTLTSGTFDVANNNATIDGDVDLDDGALTNLSGGEWDIAGDFACSIALNGGAGASLNVMGAATASNCTITGMDFSGGTQLNATNNCIDGGGNSNVLFTSPVVKTRGFFTLNTH